MHNDSHANKATDVQRAQMTNSMSKSRDTWCEMAVVSPTGRERPYGYEYQFIGVTSVHCGPYFEVYEQGVYVGCTGLMSGGRRWGVRGPDYGNMLDALSDEFRELLDRKGFIQRAWPEEIYDYLRQHIVSEHRASCGICQAGEQI